MSDVSISVGSDEDARKPLCGGVGVLRYPANVKDANGKDVDGRKMAEELAAQIQGGCVFCLPGVRDENGNYLWDFRIEH